jgi:hypothetical protein
MAFSIDSEIAALFAQTDGMPVPARDDVATALELYKVGVSTELHVRPGAPRGSDRLGDIEVVRGSWEDRLRVIRELRRPVPWLAYPGYRSTRTKWKRLNT